MRIELTKILVALKDLLQRALLFSVIAAGSASAQNLPRIEWFGGYSGAYTDRTGTAPVDSPGSIPNHQLFNGAVFSFDLNLNRHVRLVLGEISWQRHESGLDFSFSPTFQGLPFQVSSSHLNSYQLLFGADFTRRSRKYNLFTHGAAGIAARHLVAPGHDVILSDDGAAFAGGGGLEVDLARHWAYRIGQIDYLLTHMGRQELLIANPLLTALPEWQHSFRFQSGIIFRFGASGSR
jgi:hypothetical protein